MKLFGRDAEGHPKALVILAAVFLVAAGLCGTQLLILQSGRGGVDSLVIVFGLTGILELAAMAISLALILLVLAAWGRAHLFGSESGPRQDPTELTLNVAGRSNEPEKPTLSEPEGSDEETTR